ncbi:MULTISPECIES: PH domain-containing protein [unclassified Nostoc]|uniref:PH domain-containing protein n=1 Tax=unclassified Nostoc TaxID=2593658 RepID=UPI000A37075B|nr:MULTISPECIES: PH domain-containing protein [unclassified Nostoc]OUL20304.1 ribonuclease P [Nostoc sp. T09]OUL21227.1 ribonuclease P [Nostoc sp. 106C]
MGIREEIYYEGGPHIGDLIVNLLIGLTVVGIPLTVGAIVRALWLRFRITDRRISVMGGWMGRDRTDVIYSEIVKIVKVPRGIGIWGDMVLTLRNGSRLEMRAVPKFREVYDYISERVAAKNSEYSAAAK